MLKGVGLSALGFKFSCLASLGPKFLQVSNSDIGKWYENCRSLRGPFGLTIWGFGIKKDRLVSAPLVPDVGGLDFGDAHIM